MVVWAHCISIESVWSNEIIIFVRIELVTPDITRLLIFSDYFIGLMLILAITTM